MGRYILTAQQWLENIGMPQEHLKSVSAFMLACGVLVLAWVVYRIITRPVAHILIRFARHTAATWDDKLLSPKMLHAAGGLITAILLTITLPDTLSLYPLWKTVALKCCRILNIVASVILVYRTLNALYDIICENKNTPVDSLKGVRQMLQIIAIIIGVILIVSIITDRNITFILSGIGASAAVLMLIFKDSILGVVAGVKLTTNNMLRTGDWISAPKYGANGIVIDVTLTTVKVQNYDMSIVTIPPYSLVSDAFQNWRGMQESGGRRIMRSLSIDLNSIGFIQPQELEQFASEPWAEGIDLSTRQANITLFRKYLEHYITTVPTALLSPPGHITPDSTAAGQLIWMGRELQPTQHGLPVEIYLFTTETSWRPYEQVQADILDHIIATVHEFGLRVYQSPSGLDILSLTQK